MAIRITLADDSLLVPEGLEQVLTGADRLVLTDRAVEKHIDSIFLRRNLTDRSRTAGAERRPA